VARHLTPWELACFAGLALLLLAALGVGVLVIGWLSWQVALQLFGAGVGS
jgi:hypothetical protein